MVFLVPTKPVANISASSLIDQIGFALILYLQGMTINFINSTDLQAPSTVY
jgi:hypothetical protein